METIDYLSVDIIASVRHGQPVEVILSTFTSEYSDTLDKADQCTHHTRTTHTSDSTDRPVESDGNASNIRCGESPCIHSLYLWNQLLCCGIQYSHVQLTEKLVGQGKYITWTPRSSRDLRTPQVGSNITHVDI